ncbi:Methyltransferase [Flavobacterium longum]|uniref:O-methyltransferase n=1 Tax=Flavobacterium longum TaxID=1299340 RepID=UPI0039E8F57F
MWHIVKAYLEFLWQSKNEYAVHSPFVFDLLTKCVYDKTDDAAYETLDDFRESLLANDSEIDVTDFGAGSRVFKSNRRKISAIAKNAGISRKRAKLLFRLTRYFKPENILEIGTSLGLATSALSLGHPSAKITTLEGCPETASVAKRQLESFGLNNVDVKVGEFAAVLNIQPLAASHYQLIYFDGNHQKEATLKYFDLLLPTITNDTVWIFDDIHWSADMEQAWETIKQNPKVTVTIDTFQWGLVFFRKEQQKEHFVLRA